MVLSTPACTYSIADIRLIPLERDAMTLWKNPRSFYSALAWLKLAALADLWPSSGLPVALQSSDMTLLGSFLPSFSSLPDAGTPQLRGGLAYSCSSVFTGWGKRQVQVDLETNPHFCVQWDDDMSAWIPSPRSTSGFCSVSLFSLGGPGHPRSSRPAIFRSGTRG